MFLAVVSLLLLLIYCFGSLMAVDSIYQKTDISASASGFLKALPLGAWFFVGIESLNMAAGDVLSPKVVLPRGQMSCVLTLVVTALFVFFVSSALPQTTNADGSFELVILNPGMCYEFVFSHEAIVYPFFFVLFCTYTQGSMQFSD